MNIIMNYYKLILDLNPYIVFIIILSIYFYQKRKYPTLDSQMIKWEKSRKESSSNRIIKLIVFMSLLGFFYFWLFINAYHLEPVWIILFISIMINAFLFTLIVFNYKRKRMEEKYIVWAEKNHRNHKPEWMKGIRNEKKSPVFYMK